MKKLIIFVIIVGGLVGGYYWLSKNARMSIGALQGQTVVTTRGDLIVPITASGNIKPLSVTQIKSKASGEVIEIPFDLGAMVTQGDLIIKLLDRDERRNLERAEADLNRAELDLERARINWDQLKGPAMDAAQAELESASWRYKRASADLEFRRPLTQPAQGRPIVVPGEEWWQFLSAERDTFAARSAAEAKLKQASIDIRMAEQNVKTAQENVSMAKAALGDAKERLSETQIYAPLAGMILARHVQEGEVVSSAKTTFTGGTVLMEIADVSEIYAVVNVDEADIGMVNELAPPSARPGPSASQPATLPEAHYRDGENVEVTVESFPDERFEGMIVRISPQSEVVSGIATFKVWIRVTSENVDKLVGLLNTQCEAHFTARSVRDAVLVNYDAIQKNPEGEDYGVYVPVPGPEKYKFRPCKFGADNGIDVEVLDGLREGERVFTKLPQKTKREEEEAEKGSR